MTTADTYSSLHTVTATPDPLAELMRLQQEAVVAEDPAAWFAVAATVDRDGYPCCRTLTIRSINEQGIIFKVNAQSPKMRQLAENGRLELLLLWPKTLCQIRVRGSVSWQQDAELAQAWQQKRDGSKVADLMHACFLPQSSVISDRQALLTAHAEAADRLQTDTEAPAEIVHLTVLPEFVEIWRASLQDRMHDRRAYQKSGSLWQQALLVP